MTIWRSTARTLPRIPRADPERLSRRGKTGRSLLPKSTSKTASWTCHVVSALPARARQPLALIIGTVRTTTPLLPDTVRSKKADRLPQLLGVEDNDKPTRNVIHQPGARFRDHSRRQAHGDRDYQLSQLVGCVGEWVIPCHGQHLDGTHGAVVRQGDLHPAWHCNSV